MEGAAIAKLSLSPSMLNNSKNGAKKTQSVKSGRM